MHASIKGRHLQQLQSVKGAALCKTVIYGLRVLCTCLGQLRALCVCLGQLRALPTCLGQLSLLRALRASWAGLGRFAPLGIA